MKKLTKNEIYNVCGGAISQNATTCTLNDNDLTPCYIYKKGSKTAVAKINIPTAKFSLMYENDILSEMNNDKDAEYAIDCPAPTFADETNALLKACRYAR